MDHKVVPSAEMVNKAPPPSYDQLAETLQTIKCTTELTDSTATVDPTVKIPVSVEPTVTALGESEVKIYGKKLYGR